MRAQRLLLPSTERHCERASRVLVADTGVGQHAPDERTTVRRRRNLPLRLAGVGVIVVRFAARLSGRRDKKSFLSKNGEDRIIYCSPRRRQGTSCCLARRAGTGVVSAETPDVSRRQAAAQRPTPRARCRACKRLKETMPRCAPLFFLQACVSCELVCVCVTHCWCPQSSEPDCSSPSSLPTCRPSCLFAPLGRGRDRYFLL